MSLSAFRRSRRAGLALAGLATTAFVVSSWSSPAHAACSPPASASVTCSGDEANGINPPDYDASIVRTLIVRDLVSDIAPGSNTFGISLTNSSNGDNLAIDASIPGLHITTTNRAGIAASSNPMSGDAGDVSITAVYAGITGNNGAGITANSTSSGGDAGSVYVDATGSISVTGTLNAAIDARSSAMGVGSDAGAATIIFRGGDLVTNGTLAAALSASSYAGSGGSASLVSVNALAGTFTTYGTGSSGISASSTGNDGSVRVQAAGIITTYGTTSSGITGTTNGENGSVSIQSTADITTNNDNSSGINAAATTSVSGGTAGSVEVISTGDITTSGFVSHAIAAFTNSPFFGTAGAVSVTASGTLTATGTFAAGISAQSSGNSSGAVTVTLGADGIIRTTNGSGISASSNSNATNGTAADATVISHGTIEANGFANQGIAAYSSATQGTAGAASVTATGRVTATGLSVYGISSSATGEGGTASITTGPAAVVEASGDNARGLYAQTTAQAANSNAGAVDVIAGGLITATGSNAVGIEASSSAPGTAGPVTVTIDGNVTAQGQNANAIRASNYGLSEGTVHVTTRGNVTANGAAAVGIRAASGDTSGGGNITIDVLSGTITGGSGTNAAGVWLNTGATNVINNHGTITTADDIYGIAVRMQGTPGATESETVNNYGVLTGSVLLSNQHSAVNNYAGALFNMGSYAAIGPDGSFLNAGMMSPGGVGTYGGTLLTAGAVSQSATGIYAVDIDGVVADSLTIASAQTVDFAGNVLINVTTLPVLSSYIIADATTQAIDITDLGLIASPALNAKLIQPAANLLAVSFDVDFAATGLNANQTAIGDGLQTSFVAGGGGLTPILLELLNTYGIDAYAGALDQLSPEIYSYEKIETLFAAEQFSSDLMSCRIADGSGNAIIREGQCLWARGRARFLDFDHTGESIGADTTVGSFSAGAQFAVAPAVRLGLAAGYDNVSLGTGTGAVAEGDRVNVGAVAKYNPGPLLLSAAVAGGWSDFDTTRNIAFGGFAAQANGNGDVDYVLGRLHASYLVDEGGWYLKPLVDATVTGMDFGGVDETGGGAAALSVRSGSDTFFAISPAIEIGSEYRLGMSVLRPFLRGGITWRDGDNVDLAAGFAAAPAGTGAFVIGTALDDVLADVSAGFDLINTQGAVLRLQYDGRFGDETTQNSASVKGSVAF